MFNLLGKCTEFAALGVCVVLTVNGADITFPNADGAGDLASSASWGMAIPAETERPTFTSSMCVTASDDVSFAGLKLGKADITVDFDLTNAASRAAAENPRRLRLSGLVSLTNGKNMTAHVTGGVWDFLTTGGFTTYGDYGKSGNNKVYFEDCIVTNARQLTAGYGDSGIVYSIGRGAKIYTRKAGSCGYQASGLLEVKDGGELHVNTTGNGNDFNLCNSGAATKDNVIRVTGTGSVLEVTGTSTINMPSGGNPIGSLFHVTDHAYAHIGTTGGYKILGGGQGEHTAARENRWVVDNGGVLYTSGNPINVAQGPGSAGALLLVGNGGVYTNSCVINLGADYSCGAFAEFCVSNGFYRGGFPRIGHTSAASSNCTVRITGPRARVEFTNTDTVTLFAKGGGCQLILDDRAVWTNDDFAVQFNSGINLPSVADYPTNQLFEVRGGASYVSTNGLAISDINYRSWYNTIRVCDGGTIKCGKLSTSSIGNTLAVSNGTVKAKAIDWCYLSQSPVIKGFSNCCVRVQGETPRIDVENYLSINYQSTLSYELTSAGYAADYVPVTAKKLSVPAECALRVTGVEACYLANGHRRRVYTLAKTSDGIVLGNGVLDDANAYIAASVEKADRSRLTLEDNGTALRLVVNGQNGTTVIVR